MYAADPHYLNDVKQPNLTSNMRATLLDWMMEVSEEFQLKRETYHISVNLVDRYLSLKHSIKKRHFQLVGVTSLYIAAKLDVRKFFLLSFLLTLLVSQLTSDSCDFLGDQPASYWRVRLFNQQWIHWLRDKRDRAFHSSGKQANRERWELASKGL